VLASRLDAAGSSFARIATLGLLVVAGLGVYVVSLLALRVTSAHILIRAVAQRF
jgi:hypothetical protein